MRSFIILATCLLLISQGSSIKILGNIVKRCMSQEQLQTKVQNTINRVKEQDEMTNLLIKKNSTKAIDVSNFTVSGEIDLMNLLNFGNSITTGLKPVGAGSFGKVFIMNYFYNKFDKKDIVPMAVKLQTIPSDYSLSRDNNLYQTLFLKELFFNQIVSQLKNASVFFPSFGECFEVNNYFKSLMVTAENPVKTYVNISSNKVPFVVFSEKLDRTVYEYLTEDYNANGSSMFFLEDRVSIGVNLAMGVQLLNTVILHCDMKPENLMFKKIGGQEHSLKNELGIPNIQLDYMNNYNLKIIDFGLSSEIIQEGIDKTECHGGTPGFIPQEYFNNYTSHRKFDVYGIGMVLIDIEMYNLGFDMLSDVFSIPQIIARSKNNVIPQKKKEKLMGMPIVVKLISLMDMLENQEIVRTFVYTYYPYMETMLNPNIRDRPKFNESKPSDFLFFGCQTFQAIITASLYVFMNDPVFQVDLTDTLTQIDDRLEQVRVKNEQIVLENESTDDKKPLMTSATLSSQRELIMGRMDLKKKYWNALIPMITPFETRPDIGDVVATLKGIETEFQTSYEEDLLHMEERAHSQSVGDDLDYEVAKVRTAGEMVVHVRLNGEIDDVDKLNETFDTRKSDFRMMI